MVHAVRMGSSMRSVAAAFGVSVGTVALWVTRAHGQRLDRVDFADGKPGRATNRLPARLERRILRARELLRTSVLGEYGAQAIACALAERHPNEQVPGRATIHRVLLRHGAIDSVRRQRRAPPPKGWYLPEVAQARAELDSFDFIEDLKIANGPLVSILTATSLHGALADAWAMTEPTAQHALERLLQRWRQDGLPGYAQFDNDTVFQGTHRFADSIGRVIRLCLALGVPGLRPAARAGLPERNRRLQRSLASQGLAAPSGCEPGPARSLLGRLHRRASHQDREPGRCRARSSALAQGLRIGSACTAARGGRLHPANHRQRQRQRAGPTVRGRSALDSTTPAMRSRLHESSPALLRFAPT